MFTVQFCIFFLIANGIGSRVENEVERGQSPSVDYEIARLNSTIVNETYLAEMLFNCTGLRNGVYHGVQWCMDGEFFVCSQERTYYFQCGDNRYVDKYLNCLPQSSCPLPIDDQQDEPDVYVRKPVIPKSHHQSLRRHKIVEAVVDVGYTTFNGLSKTARYFCEMLAVCVDRPAESETTTTDTTAHERSTSIQSRNGTCSAAQTESALETLAAIERDYIAPIQMISEKLKLTGSVCEWTPSVFETSMFGNASKKSDRAETDEDWNILADNVDKECSLCTSLSLTAQHTVAAAKSLTYIAAAQFCNSSTESAKCRRITQNVMLPLTLALHDVFSYEFMCKSTNHICISEEEKPKYETREGGILNLGRQSCELCVENLRWIQELNKKFLDISAAFCLNEKACDSYRNAVNLVKNVTHLSDSMLLGFCRIGLCFPTEKIEKEMASQCRNSTTDPWITCQDLLCLSQHRPPRKCSTMSGKIISPRCLRASDSLIADCDEIACLGGEKANEEYFRCGGF